MPNVKTLRAGRKNSVKANFFKQKVLKSKKKRQQRLSQLKTLANTNVKHTPKIKLAGKSKHPGAVNKSSKIILAQPGYVIYGVHQ